MESKIEASNRKSAALEQLLIYAIQAFAGLGLFSVFVFTSIVMRWLGEAVGGIEFAIVFRITGLTISSLGAICCIALVVKNTIVFIKFLIKGVMQQTSAEKS